MALIGGLLPGMNTSALLGKCDEHSTWRPSYRCCQIFRVRICLKKIRLVRSFRSQRRIQNQSLDGHILVDTDCSKYLYNNSLGWILAANRAAHINPSMRVVGIPVGIPRLG